MAEDNIIKTGASVSSTDLAFERTLLALERTLMAWIRTATSMISFGFTIYKFFEEIVKSVKTPSGIFTPRVVGILMILFGFLGLLLALIQHFIEVGKIRKIYPHVPFSISALLAFLILGLGIFLLIGALLRQ